MIAIIGVTGSGKSTQRDLLAKQLNCPWIYTGELLRQNLTGEQRDNLLAGKIIDDSITIPLLDQDLLKKDARNQECILDGSPRTMEQAVWFADKVKTDQFKLTGLIHLSLNEQDAERRLAGRERQDDSPAAIAERFEVYETRTKPVLAYLTAQGIKIHDIPAAGTAEDVNQLIRQALELPVARVNQ